MHEICQYFLKRPFWVPVKKSCVLFVQTLPAFYQIWTCWGIKGVSISYHVHVVWDVKNIVLEIEDMISVYIFIVSLYMAINKLHRDVKYYSIIKKSIVGIVNIDIILCSPTYFDNLHFSQTKFSLKLGIGLDFRASSSYLS